jgi:hypothetical protein
MLALAFVAGCGDSDGGKTRVPPDTSPPSSDTTGATDPEPEPEPEPEGERIDVGDILMFETPSGRIGCAASTDPTSLRCDTAFPTSFSKSDRRCEFGDYGQAFVIKPSGAAEAICAGDTVLSANDARTIEYGKTWLLGPYTCVSRKSGLRCENGEGHGVELSLESQRVF